MGCTVTFPSESLGQETHYLNTLVTSSKLGTLSTGQTCIKMTTLANISSQFGIQFGKMKNTVGWLCYCCWLSLPADRLGADSSLVESNCARASPCKMQQAVDACVLPPLQAKCHKQACLSTSTSRALLLHCCNVSCYTMQTQMTNPAQQMNVPCRVTPWLQQCCCLLRPS